MSDDSSMNGKEFDFCESERDGIELRYQRSLELNEQAKAIAAQAKAEREIAVSRALAFALKRVGAPADSKVEWKFTDGMPSGFKIVDKAEAPPQKTAEKKPGEPAGEVVPFGRQKSTKKA